MVEVKAKVGVLSGDQIENTEGKRSPTNEWKLAEEG